MEFSRQGNKLLSIDASGVIDLLEFDRCTGNFTSCTTIDSVLSQFPQELYLSCSFSSSGNMAYVASEVKLWQFNLLSPTPANGFPLFTNINPDLGLGQHLIGPDNKIYISNRFYNQLGPPAIYDTINTHLSVINYPDNIGVSCSFQRYASQLYIGRGRKTTLSMPNMPNYNLGPVSGSACDSLFTGVAEILNNKQVRIHPNPVAFEAIITSASDSWFYLYSIDGILVWNKFISTSHETFSTRNLPNGIYIYTIFNEKGELEKGKLVINK
jgi:hypothetical protein